MSLARDEVSGGEVVLRTLPPEIITDTATIERLAKETAGLNGLQHEGIVSWYDFCLLRDPGAAFLVSEHVEGQTLRELLSDNPESFREENRFRALAEQILSAVDYAHRRGITHRDLTSDNVLLTPDDRIRILDFGIDAIIDESLPEAQKKLSWANRKLSSTGMDAERSISIDIYSLGKLFREMLGGGSESSEADQDLSEADQEKALLPVAGISAGLNSLILSCLSRDSSQRPKTVKEILGQLLGGEVPPAETNDDALADLRAKKQPPLAGRDEEASEEPVPASTGKRRRIAGLVVLVLLILAALLFWQWPRYVRERIGAQVREDVQSASVPGGLESGNEATDLPDAKEPGSPDEGKLVGPTVKEQGSSSLPPEAAPQKGPDGGRASTRGSGTSTPRQGATPGALRRSESPTRPSRQTRGGYTVQVGAFELSQSAQKLTSRLRDSGYDARIQEPAGSNKYYLVWIGSYESVEAASKTQKRLESAGFHTYVRRVPAGPPGVAAP